MIESILINSYLLPVQVCTFLFFLL